MNRPRKLKKCLECGIYFMARTDNLGKFCSRSCNASFNNRRIARHFGFKHSQETIALLREKRALQVTGLDTRNKMRASHLGKKKSLVHSKNIRMSKMGAKNPNWKGGITPLRKAIRKLPEYLIWRNYIFSRDQYKCVICGSKGNLHADHFPITYAQILSTIQSIQEAPSCNDLWDVNNGRTLCVTCHRETETFGMKNRFGKKKGE